MDKNKNTKQSGKGQAPQGKGQGNQQRKNDPTAQSDKHTKQQSSSSPNQPGGQPRTQPDSAQNTSEQSGRSNQTITNQDEQHQVTNAGSDKPMGEEETEGDRQREERLKPYKNVGDDSGETEKKSPTMK
jgi:hypothetical protein